MTDKQRKTIDDLTDHLYELYKGKIRRAMIALHVQVGLAVCKSEDEYESFLTLRLSEELNDNDINEIILA